MRAVRPVWEESEEQQNLDTGIVSLSQFVFLRVRTCYHCIAFIIWNVAVKKRQDMTPISSMCSSTTRARMCSHGSTVSSS